MRVIPYALLALTLPAAAADWPQFRGPNGSGADPASKDLPVEIEQSKNVMW